MGTLRDALICGYYDEEQNYIIEMDVKELKKIIDEQFNEYKDFLTNIETKIKLYALLKYEFTKGLLPKCNQFVVELKGIDE